MGEDKEEVRIYRGQWISGEGQPWLISAGWESTENSGVEQWVFIVDRQKAAAETFLQRRVLRHRPTEFGPLKLKVDLEFLLATAREIAEYEIEQYLDCKTDPAAQERFYRPRIKLEQVDLAELVRLSLLRENRAILLRIAGQMQSSGFLRSMLRALDSVPTISLDE